MNIQETQSPTGDWLSRMAVKRIAFWSVIYFGIIWGLATFLYLPVVEPIHNSWVLNGHGLASFPMWGYSILIRLLGSVGLVVMLQSVLGAIATAALMVRLNCLAPQATILTTTLFLTSLPWLSFMGYAYQMPISSAFTILMLLALEMAMRSEKIAWGLVAGVLVGIGQNFRSELLLLSGTILVIVFILRKKQWFRCPSIKPLVVCVGVALIFQVPWALNCYFNAGRFSLSESNLGHVVFLGLGNIPSNPWKIELKDEFAQKTVTKAGLQCSSLSFQGGDFLKRKFVENVKNNPTAYVKCLELRIWNTIYFPFTFVPLASTPAEEHAVRELIGRIKSSAARPDAPATQPADHSVSRIKIVVMMLYSSSLRNMIRAVAFLGLVGFFLAMGKAPFPLSHPLVLCLGIAVFYRFGLNLTIIASGNYMTGVYLCYLPFAVNSLWAVFHRRTKANSALNRVLISSHHPN